MKLTDISDKKRKKNINDDTMYWLFEICIFIIMIFYHFVDYTIPPPQEYPWFYPMLNALFCFCYFFSIFLLSNYELLKMVSEKDEKKDKIKED